MSGASKAFSVIWFVGLAAAMSAIAQEEKGKQADFEKHLQTQLRLTAARIRGSAKINEEMLNTDYAMVRRLINEALITFVEKGWQPVEVIDLSTHLWVEFRIGKRSIPPNQRLSLNEMQKVAARLGAV